MLENFLVVVDVLGLVSDVGVACDQELEVSALLENKRVVSCVRGFKSVVFQMVCELRRKVLGSFISDIDPFVNNLLPSLVLAEAS